MDVIVDIDGTIADCSHRLRHIEKKPKDWPAFHENCHLDPPIVHMVRLVHSIRNGFGSPGMDNNRIIFCSGRPEDYSREKTMKWLNAQGFLRVPLYMRKAKDFRDDGIVKLELLAAMRADGFDPVIAIDDRSRVVAAWRSAGLICLQCAEGAF